MPLFHLHSTVLVIRDSSCLSLISGVIYLRMTCNQTHLSLKSHLLSCNCPASGVANCTVSTVDLEIIFSLGLLILTIPTLHLINNDKEQKINSDQHLS